MINMVEQDNIFPLRPIKRHRDHRIKVPYPNIFFSYYFTETGEDFGIQVFLEVIQTHIDHLEIVMFRQNGLGHISVNRLTIDFFEHFNPS